MRIRISTRKIKNIRKCLLKGYKIFIKWKFYNVKTSSGLRKGEKFTIKFIKKIIES